MREVGAKKWTHSMLPIQVVAHAYLGPLEGLDGLRYSREEDMGCSGCPPPRLPPPLGKGSGDGLVVGSGRS